jgi:hypothetical protein
MSTLDLLDDSFPHGTPTGYRNGCRTAACPALIPCRTVHTRYAGDYTFAKRFDSGMPLAEILELDAAARAQARQRDRAAAAAPTAAAPKPRPKTSHPRKAPAPRKTPAPIRPAQQTPAATPPRSKASKHTHPGYSWLTRARAALDELAPAPREQRRQDLDDYEAALDQHIAGLTRWRAARATLRRELTAATDALDAATTATRAGLPVGGAVERALHEATQRHRTITDALAVSSANRPASPAKPRAPKRARIQSPRQLQPHGTNACRARGCDRPECIEAARVYHREWMEQRRMKQISAEHHGTAYGYQLGCKDRETCPAEISCADASLAEERRRRREAGIPEQAPRVPAEPIRQHVRALMDSGMGVLKIAEEANVSKTGVKILLYGRSGARKGELPREIEATKAQRLLALTPLSRLSATA